MLDIKINAVLACCALCCFQYYLQPTLELLLILFTMNTWIVIKKMSIKEKIINCIKWENIKNRTYHFYNNMTEFKSCKPNLLKIDKKHYIGINIYYIGYITIKKKKNDYESIYSVNSLYLRVNHANRYIKKNMQINT